MFCVVFFFYLFVDWLSAVFSNVLKIPQIQVLADSDEQEVVQQVQVYDIYGIICLLQRTFCE